MKAAVFKGNNSVHIENINKPEIHDPTDAIVNITLTSICGTDLHMYHGKIPFQKNHILGHEFVGIVEEVGTAVKNIQPGDKVLGTSTIACGYCRFCKMELYSQCENSNPNNKGTAFFGSPPSGGGYQGTQAEYVRVPYANMVLYKIPENISDEQGLILSDILPTGYFAADMADIKPGESVAVYGAGPVGQMAMQSAKLMGAKIYAVDHLDKRLRMAEEYSNAQPINYSKTDPIKEIMKLTDKNGVDKVIEAVGMEAETGKLESISKALNLESSSGQSLRWAINSVRKGGIISIVGAYLGDVDNFPIGTVQMRNITLKSGNCPHRKYLDTLVRYIQEGKLDPTFVITHRFSLNEIEEAYNTFDHEKNKCVKEMITV